MEKGLHEDSFVRRGRKFPIRGELSHYSYVTPDADILYMQRFVVPTKLNRFDARRYELREYLTDENIANMREVGINTIRELANAPLYTVLKLRGFDYPQVEEKDRMTFLTVCDKIALAKAIVSKCTVSIPKMLYAGERNQPWNIIPEWALSIDEPELKGSPPSNLKQPVLWHRPNQGLLLHDRGDDRRRRGNGRSVGWLHL